MTMPNAIGGLTNLTTQLKHAARFDVKAATRAVAAAAQAKLSTPTAAMRQILSQYNMTSITPNSFATMVQQLSAQGAISQKDAQQLAAIPGQLQNAGVGPDESVNVLDFYQQQITKVQDSAAQSPNAASQTNFTQLTGQMQWLAKFAAIRQGNTSGVNAVA